MKCILLPRRYVFNTGMILVWRCNLVMVSQMESYTVLVGERVKECTTEYPIRSISGECTSWLILDLCFIPTPLVSAIPIDYGSFHSVAFKSTLSPFPYTVAIKSTLPSTKIVSLSKQPLPLLIRHHHQSTLPVQPASHHSKGPLTLIYMGSYQGTISPFQSLNPPVVPSTPKLAPSIKLNNPLQTLSMGMKRSANWGFRARASFKKSS